MNDKVSQMYLNILIAQLKINIMNSNIDIKSLIKNHDTTSSGLIKKLDMMYILSEKCKLDTKITQTLIESLPQAQTGVIY
jgi:Ca2+-binding EF-hand superfamily protein